MQHKFFLIILIFSTVFLTDGFAQAPVQNEPRTISGGVLNGKAVKLVTPSYPKEAKDANADGAVLIQVTIDVQGNVIAAEAVSALKTFQHVLPSSVVKPDVPLV